MKHSVAELRELLMSKLTPFFKDEQFYQESISQFVRTDASSDKW